MKKIVYFFTAILVILVVYQLNKLRLDSRDKEIFTNLTGISEFEVTTHVRESHYFYLITKVSSIDKNRILNTHYFKSSPIDLRGNLPLELHNINLDDYVYYLEDTGHGYLGYVLYLVSKKDNTIVVYTNYAD